MRSPLVFLVLAGALTLATSSLAEMTNFKADLKAASEVPPIDSRFSLRDCNYDTASKKLSYKGSYSGFTGRPLQLISMDRPKPVITPPGKFQFPLMRPRKARSRRRRR